MTRRHGVRLHGEDRGAAAVEFAFVVILLVPLVIAIMEFGWAFHSQITLTSAAREGVRVMALDTSAGAPAAARDRTVESAPSLNPALTAGQVVLTERTSGGDTVTLSGPCTPGRMVRVTAEYEHNTLTQMFLNDVTLRGTGVMRCGG